MTKRDKARISELLDFLAYRLENIYGESPLLDYMHAAH